MGNLPKEIQNYIVNKILVKRVPAYFKLDINGRILNYYGNINHYFQNGIRKNSLIIDLLPAIDYCFPFDSKDIVIPFFSLSENLIIDIHIFQEGDNVFLIILDSSIYEGKIREVLQNRNKDLLDYKKYLNTYKDLIIFDVVSFQNMLILEYLDNFNFLVRGRLPQWVDFIKDEDVLNEIEETLLIERFPFLEVFINNAKQFWNEETNGKIKSEIWAENDSQFQDTYFEATALYIDKRSILLIEHSHSYVQEKLFLIQKARELNLEREKRLKAEKALNIINQELRDLNATKDKFFSIIAHDIKNPLAGLKNLIDLVLNHYKNMTEEDIFDIFQLLDTTSNILYKLLDNLLLWSRSQTGSISFNPSFSEINNIIDTNIKMFLANANKKNITIVSNLKNKINAYIDEDLIDTVLRNLIGNAIKFTPNDGTITIDVVEKGNDIELSVQDTGVGISNKDLNKLFRIDTHFSTHGTANEYGTGLGLILCKEFIELHKGSIWVESKEGEGSKFIFSIPQK